MLKSRLPQIAAALPAKVDAAVRAGAQHVAGEAQDRVPVDSGNLRDSIHVDREGVGEYLVVAGDGEAFYGHLVEFGTTKVPARPFLIPAAESGREAITAAVAVALKGL